MEDFIAFKEETFQKFSNSEQGRKIVEHLQKLHKKLGKLSKDEKKLFAEEFGDKLRTATDKLESLVVKDERVVENNFSFNNLILIMAVILIGKCIKCIISIYF